MGDLPHDLDLEGARDLLIDAGMEDEAQFIADAAGIRALDGCTIRATARGIDVTFPDGNGLKMSTLGSMGLLFQLLGYTHIGESAHPTWTGLRAPDDVAAQVRAAGEVVDG